MNKYGTKYGTKKRSSQIGYSVMYSFYLKEGYYETPKV